MSFGTSIGDVLAVSKLALEIWGRLRNSSDQFVAIRGEVTVLKTALDYITERTSSGHLSPEQITQLSTPIAECRKVLEDLDAKIKMYESLGSPASGLGSKTEKLYKKLKWDKGDIDGLRLRLISNTNLLEIFDSGMTSNISYSINAKVDVLGDRLRTVETDTEDKDRQSLLVWLSPLDFRARQDAISSRRQEGTGRWLVESEEFKDWVQTKGGCLVCQGIPGAGKTLLTSLVIDHLRLILSEGATIIYIYCDYRATAEQSLISLLLSLLKQSLQQQAVIPTNIREALRGYKQNGTRPSITQASHMLQASLRTSSRVYIIVDALDELSSENQVRHKLLKELRGLQAGDKCNILTTSRHMYDLASEFQDPQHLEIRASAEDVQRYLRGHMSELPKCVMNKVGLQELVIDTIVAAVDGMFLLARLHFDSLKDQTSPKAIKMALKHLPKGGKALDEAYNGVLHRINDQLVGLRSLAMQVLAWLTYAKRILSIDELQHAIAIELGKTDLDEDSITEVDELVSVCAGLVQVDRSNNIRLVHYTTQEYLENNGGRVFPDFHQAIADRCLTYLKYDAFEIGWRCIDPDIRKDGVFLKYPFYIYAARFWTSHVQDSSHGDLEYLATEFLKDDYKVSHAARTLLHTRDNTGHYLLPETRMFESSHIKNPITAMHLLAHLGADEIILMALRHGFNMQVKDYDNSTPLLWAARNGHEKTVELILSQQGVDVNHQSKSRKWTTLHRMLFLEMPQDRLGVVKCLLACENIDVNLTDEVGMTSLWVASLMGQDLVAQLLLDRGDIDVNKGDLEGRAPLSIAAKVGNTAIVSLLLDRADIKVNSKDQHGRSPLSRAATSDDIDITQLLLSDPRVDFNSRDHSGKTCLHDAILNGCERSVKLLLSLEDLVLDLCQGEVEDVLARLETEAQSFAEEVRTGEEWSNSTHGDGLEDRQAATLNLLRAALQERTQS